MTEAVRAQVKLFQEENCRQIENDLNATLTAREHTRMLKSGLGPSSNLGTKRTFIQYRGEGSADDMIDQYN